jgi:hypothetical protein
LTAGFIVGGEENYRFQNWSDDRTNSTPVVDKPVNSLENFFIFRVFSRIASKTARVLFPRFG